LHEKACFRLFLVVVSLRASAMRCATEAVIGCGKYSKVQAR
jgi:hypothetical protein